MLSAYNNNISKNKEKKLKSREINEKRIKQFENLIKLKIKF